MVNFKESEKSNWHFGVDPDSKSPELTRYSPLHDKPLGNFKVGRQFEVSLAVENSKAAFAHG